MIFKGHRRHGAKALLNYASRGGEASCVAGTMPLETPLPEIVAHFQRVHELRPELRSAKVIHLSIATAEQDRALTPTEWGEIARISAQRLGISDGPWQGWVHTDGHTPHLHLVGSAIRFDGLRVESRDHFKEYKRVARDLELKFVLWRVGNRAGEPILPPVAVAPTMGGPRFEVPASNSGYRQVVKDSVYGILRQHPGIRLPDLRNRLAEWGVDLVPKFSVDGAKLVGLGFRVGDAFDIASKVDKTFTLAGLQKHHDVAYDPPQDLHRLRDFSVPKVPFPAVTPPPPVVEQPAHVVEMPVLTFGALSPTPKQEYRHALRQIALNVSKTVWSTLNRIDLQPARPPHRPNTCPRSRHRI